VPAEMVGTTGAEGDGAAGVWVTRSPGSALSKHTTANPRTRTGMRNVWARRAADESAGRPEIERDSADP
jgi:hypothetical protein